MGKPKPNTLEKPTLTPKNKIMNEEVKNYLKERNVDTINSIWSSFKKEKVVGWNYKAPSEIGKTKIINGLYKLFEENNLDYSIAEPYTGTSFSIYLND